MVIHLHLFFLALDLGRELEFNALLEASEADFRALGEIGTSVRGNDSNTIRRSLTEAGRLMGAEIADTIHNSHEILLGEVARSKVLNHVVEDEESKLVAFLL